LAFLKYEVAGTRGRSPHWVPDSQYLRGISEDMGGKFVLTLNG